MSPLRCLLIFLFLIIIDADHADKSHLKVSMLFNITNPSDPYTMVAPDLETAALSVLLIGQGQYGLAELTGDKSGNMPIFLNSGHDEWFTKQFGHNFSTSLDAACDTPARRAELVKALASVRIGDAAQRRAFDLAAADCETIEAYKEVLEVLHDFRRTSENDIGRHAWKLAMAVSETAPAEGETVQ